MKQAQIQMERASMGVAAKIFESGGRWGLSDMINFMINHYIVTLNLVQQEVLNAVKRSGEEGKSALITDIDKETIMNNLTWIVKKATELGFETVNNRAERIGTKLRINSSVSCFDIAQEMNVMLESFADDSKYFNLYAYPKEKAKKLLAFRSEWAAALAAFPSILKQAESAVDLYALGQNDASVFHSMQVLEPGLRALATSVGETFDVQQWGEIIGKIEGRIAVVQKSGIPGVDKKEKDARLQFLSEAAKEFRYFKDGWRNYVSHGRGDYDENEARGVLEHVRSFMNHLATELKE